MHKDKKRLFFMGLLSTIVFLTVILLAIMEIKNGKITFGSIFSIIIPLILIVFMVFFITRKYRDLKQGMPLEDERSEKVINQAAKSSFYVTLYWLLAISFFENFFAGLIGQETLEASQVTGGGIAGMAIMFFAFWLYYNKKG